MKNEIQNFNYLCLFCRRKFKFRHRPDKFRVVCPSCKKHKLQRQSLFVVRDGYRSAASINQESFEGGIITDHK